jgi:hypothetical protein
MHSHHASEESSARAPIRGDLGNAWDVAIPGIAIVHILRCPIMHSFNIALVHILLCQYCCPMLLSHYAFIQHLLLAPPSHAATRTV